LWLIAKIFLEFNISRVCELGAGSSTRLFDLINTNRQSQIFSLESDEWWAESHRVCKNVQVLSTSLRPVSVLGQSVTAYDIGVLPDQWIPEFFVVDAPLGTARFSRLGAWLLIEKMIQGDFIILFDDVDRAGEAESIRMVKAELERSGTKYHSRQWSALKSQHVFFSDKFLPVKYW
jgi:hypothetical protein